MLRMFGSLCTGLAVLFVLPAALPQPGGAAGSQSLDRLRADLARLERLQPELQAAAAANASIPGVSMASLVDLTEAGGADAHEDDRRLAELRDDVARLQEALDERLASNKPVPARPTEFPSAHAVFGASDVERSERAVIGAGGAAHGSSSPDHRAAGEPPADTAQAVHAATAVHAGAPPVPTYSANPQRQGQALLMAGRAEEALAVFQALARGPESLYWLGRVHSRLGRPAEAVRAYEEVLALEPAGAWAEMARLDLDFVRWRARFDGIELPLGRTELPLGGTELPLGGTEPSPSSGHAAPAAPPISGHAAPAPSHTAGGGHP